MLSWYGIEEWHIRVRQAMTGDKYLHVPGPVSTQPNIVATTPVSLIGCMQTPRLHWLSRSSRCRCGKDFCHYAHFLCFQWIFMLDDISATLSATRVPGHSASTGQGQLSYKWFTVLCVCFHQDHIHQTPDIYPYLTHSHSRVQTSCFGPQEVNAAVRN